MDMAGGSGLVGKIADNGVSFELFGFRNLFAGMSSIEEITWVLMSMVILWVGAFSIMGSMPVAKTITDGIKGYGESTFKFAAKVPYWAPILPHGGSIGGMVRKADPVQRINELEYKWEQEKKKGIDPDTGKPLPKLSSKTLAALREANPDYQVIVDNMDEKTKTIFRENSGLIYKTLKSHEEGPDDNLSKHAEKLVEHITGIDKTTTVKDTTTTTPTPDQGGGGDPEESVMDDGG